MKYIIVILLIILSLFSCNRLLKKVQQKSQKAMAKAKALVKSSTKLNSKAKSQHKTKSKTGQLTDEEKEILNQVSLEGDFLHNLVGNYNLAQPSCNLEKDGNYIGCITFQKMKALFPDHKDDTDENDLNKFTEKFIYIYDHYMAILSTEKAECLDGISVPSTYSFEKEILYSQINTPCNHHREICTIREYQDEVLKPREIEFSPDPRVQMGKDLDDNCIVILPTVHSDEDQLFYICHEDKQALNNIKWQLNRLLFKAAPEKHNSVVMLSQDKTSVTDVYFHIEDNKLIIDKNKPDIYAVPEEEVIDTEKPIVEWDCAAGNCLRPAYTLDEAGEKFPMEGSDYEPERCFAVPLVKAEDGFQKGSEKKTSIYYFCHTTNLDESESTPKQSALQAFELVSTFNSLYIQAQLIKAMERVEGDEKEKEKAQALLYASLHSFKLSFNDDCIEQGLSEDACELITVEGGKSYLLNNLCQQKEECVSLVEEYEAPLGLIANDPDNPYLTEDKTVKYADFMITVNTYRDLIDDKTAEEEGESVEMPLPTLKGTTIEEVKESAASRCVTGDGNSLMMKMFYLPFFAEVDPWLEFFNVINEGAQE